MKTVMQLTICSSMKNKHLIKQLLTSPNPHNYEFVFPNLDFEPNGELTERQMRRLQADHFDAIRNADGIYVLNPDGYVGCMVTAEIGYAKALNKTIYFAAKTGEIELDVLADEFVEFKDSFK